MADWVWLLIALGVGVPLLAGAVVLDLRRRRRTEGPRPQGSTPGTMTPAYLTQGEVDDLPLPQAAADPWPRQGRRFGFGYAHPDFRTHGDAAQRDNAVVLVVGGDIHDMRQLIAPLSRATEASPLIVVAPSYSPEALATLAANRRALHTPVVACTAGHDQLEELATWCGARALASSDLSAGYVPAEALGRARRWISDARNSWVEPSFPHAD